ncbi:MAG: hypothetical protein CMJ77_07645 [Planctomycetaceae bacterium]|nr:hypothetical protein [Planctomycetaceae bacterium]
MVPAKINQAGSICRATLGAAFKPGIHGDRRKIRTEAEPTETTAYAYHHDNADVILAHTSDNFGHLCLMVASHDRSPCAQRSERKQE